MERAILLVGAVLVYGCAPSDATAALFCDNSECGRFVLSEGEGGGGNSATASSSSSGDGGAGGMTGPPCDCDDTNPCDGLTECTEDGICIRHPPSLPADESACTTDSCSENAEPVHTLIDVDDGNPCTLDWCDHSLGPRHDEIPDCQS